MTTRRSLLKSTIALTATAALPLSLSTPAFARETSSREFLKEFFSHSENTVGTIKLRYKEELARIYQQRGYAPLWIQKGKMTFTSKAVLKKLSSAQLLGLDASKYYSRLLSQLSASKNPQHRFQFEIIMTDALYTYFDDVAHGNLRQNDASSGWNLKEGNIDVRAITTEFFTGNHSFRQTIDALEPDHPRYKGLLKALHSHYVMAAAGGWTEFPNGPALEYDESDSRIPVLKQRLQQSGDLAETHVDGDEKFNLAVFEGLTNFQNRHGLQPDGVLGPKTVAELNVPLHKRISQIHMNLDRWRWLTRSDKQSNIIVNVPGYDLDVTLHGELAMTMKVVVGKPGNRTPLFSDEMEHLVVNPSWYVPSSITRELLPRELARPGYLARNRFEALSLATEESVSLASLDMHDKHPNNFLSNYRLRQLPGKSNALGDIKFMFPNDYSIYLHDTNAKNLFDKTERAYSHGCVRLEKPFALAKLLLQHDGRSAAQIDTLLGQKSTTTLVLDRHVPVHLTYQTAWVDGNGKTHFRPDIYGHDKKAGESLDKGKSFYADAENYALDATNDIVVSSG
ncbi:hypothetical protein AB833_07055 [Chromatiales bacterium (ex Bugula neritina AB1)]|nr:hypothetical protein AB833_07055 [Chromatiales bacterium (ex Bugula neritina AB1)]